ncbi:MAG: tRNA uridine-5-carboxymethylaminomethyl(34) synthesis GTPase MnmE [Clostridia bacterium]|nr:tRNA uridine-5-carboxymethylaminomethyl(34) synthesis GTPase MnmE [Clostridia bacterium]
MNSDRNIVAISTALGNGGISIIRMSGKSVLKIADSVFSAKIPVTQFEPRKLYLGTFEHGDIKDKCLCVYFKSPFSYTGEDMVEFQCHGGMTLTNRIFEELVAVGCEPATKGEFSKLAFLNGKISLDEAEGVIDIINAESESELKCGYNLMQGRLKEQIEKEQNVLTELLAKIEVSLDYPEEDLEEETREGVLSVLKDVKTDLKNILDTASFGRCIKDGVRVLIFGRTNAGKSSLLNSLLNYDRAIVTDIQGTTRDTLEEVFQYKGFKFILVDSAGIRQSSDVVESIGINKSLKELESADVVLYIIDGSVALDDEDKAMMKSLSDKKCIVCVNKADLGTCIEIDKEMFDDVISISTKTGQGVEELKEILYNFVSSKNVNNGSVVLTNVRHIDAIKRAMTELENAIDATNNYINLDLVSIDIKNVWLALGDITGNSDNEKIIDDIFSKFCVGK